MFIVLISIVNVVFYSCTYFFKHYFINFSFFSSEPGSPNIPATSPAKPFHFTVTGDKPKPLSPNDKSKGTCTNRLKLQGLAITVLKSVVPAQVWGARPRICKHTM